SALGLPTITKEQRRDSQSALRVLAKSATLPALLTAEVGAPIVLPFNPREATRYRIACEDGRVIEGQIDTQANGGASLRPVEVPGYHQLTVGEQTASLAVAPHRCFSVTDVPGPGRPWGLAAQLYSLRRAGDVGVGDYTALGTLARAAARFGAD